MSDVDCTKKAICEIYQNSQELGPLGKRAMHGLDMMESLSYMSLPDEFFNILDEFMVSTFFFVLDSLIPNAMALITQSLETYT